MSELVVATGVPCQMCIAGRKDGPMGSYYQCPACNGTGQRAYPQEGGDRMMGMLSEEAGFRNTIASQRRPRN